VTPNIISRHSLRHIERHFVRILRMKFGKRQLTSIQFVKRIQNDVQDDIGLMRDAK